MRHRGVVDVELDVKPGLALVGLGGHHLTKDRDGGDRVRPELRVSFIHSGTVSDDLGVRSSNWSEPRVPRKL